MSGHNGSGSAGGWGARAWGALASAGIVATMAIVTLTRCADGEADDSANPSSERVVDKACQSSQDCPFPLTCLQYSGSKSYCTTECLVLSDACGGNGNCCLQALSARYCAPESVCDDQLVDTDTGGTGETDGAETVGGDGAGDETGGGTGDGASSDTETDGVGDTA